MAAIFYWIRRFFGKLRKNVYKEVFKVADFDSIVENEKLQMAELD